MLPRSYKLKKDKDFEKVFKKGKYSQKNFIKIKFSKNGLEMSRFGLMVGLKASKKSTQRNRIKRRLEESIRLNLKRIRTGFDIIIMVNPEIAEKDYHQIEENLINLLEENNLVKD